MKEQSLADSDSGDEQNDYQKHQRRESQSLQNREEHAEHRSGNQQCADAEAPRYTGFPRTSRSLRHFEV